MPPCSGHRCFIRRRMSPPTPLPASDPAEASRRFLLTSGETLWDVSQHQTVAVVFLRHFGCTFTRQILRGLEDLERAASSHNAQLVLVHMLKEGNELKYLASHGGIPRIADPHCELYRAFGLGKGGFMELFGPRVWIMGMLSVFKGCGVGHLAGDGRQMPGAFLFHQGKITSSQRAHVASDLPDLAALFPSSDLPTPA